METYSDIDNDSGVTRYEIGQDCIIVEFESGKERFYKFKRYEDSSLEYTSINSHKGESVGGFDTTSSAEEYESM